MAKSVRIRLPGGNDFYEKINAPTRKQAVKIAKARYPGYQHVSCVTECWSDEEEESNRQFHRDLDRREKEHDGDFWTNKEFGNPVGSSKSVSGSSSSSSSSDDVSMLDVGTALFLMWCGWKLVKWFTYVAFAPTFAAWWSARVYQKHVDWRLNYKTQWSILLAIGVGATSFVGTEMLQKEYMPEVIEARTEIVNDSVEGVKSWFN